MVALPPVMVLTCQMTGIVVFEEDVAVQASDAPEATVRVEVWVESRQVTALMAMAAEITIVAAVVVRVVCAWAIAVMVILLRLGTVVGAVYRPFASIVPKVELPPATPPACQLTSVLLRFEIVAVHCVCPLTVSEALAQEAVIVGVAVVVLEPLPQEFRANSAGRSGNVRSRRCHEALLRHIEQFD